jgi:hypothetical protein
MPVKASNLAAEFAGLGAHEVASAEGTLHRAVGADRL